MFKLHSEKLVRKNESGTVIPKGSFRLRFLKKELLFKSHFKAILLESPSVSTPIEAAEAIEGRFVIDKAKDGQMEGTFKRDNTITPKADITKKVNYEVSPVGKEIQPPLQSALFKDVKELKETNDGNLLIGEGSVGEYVSKIQQGLNQVFEGMPGYKPLKLDKNFGPLTKAAVSLFQKGFHLQKGTNGVIGQETIQKLDNQLFIIEPKIKKPKPGAETAKDWKSLIAFKPGQSSYDELSKRAYHSPFNGPFNRWQVQEIERAQGEKLNLDIYCMNVSELPVVDNNKLTAEELQEYIRTHLNDFFDQKISEFSSYSDRDEEKWQSKNPINSVMHFDIYEGPEPIKTMSKPIGGPDDLSVITTEYTKDHWIFTTVQSPGDFGHPVNGHRKFGFKKDAQQNLVFYVTGTDRVSGKIDTWVEDAVFEGGHKKWLAYQKNVVAFINNNKGKASIGLTISERVSWKNSSSLLDNLID